MTQHIQPAQVLSYGTNSSDSWRPVVKLAAWAGIALGAFNVICIVFQCSRMSGFGTLAWLFSQLESFDSALQSLWAIANVVIIIGAIGCLIGSDTARRIFVWSAGSLAPLGFSALIASYLRLRNIDPIFVIWELYVPFGAYLVAEAILALLLCLLMTRRQAKATFGVR